MKAATTMPNSLDREQFEQWYACNAFDYARDPIGSRDCGLQWAAWQAGAAAEREACAELCGEMLSTQHEPGTSERRAFNVATIECEMAIRDRGIT